MGPQRVREAFVGTKKLVVYWIEQAARAAFPTNHGPNPEALIQTDLPKVLDFARAISPQYVDLILGTISALRNAKGEFEKLERAPVSFNRVKRIDGPGPLPYLQQADELLSTL